MRKLSFARAVWVFWASSHWSQEEYEAFIKHIEPFEKTIWEQWFASMGYATYPHIIRSRMPNASAMDKAIENVYQQIESAIDD